jgi:hypothetical protein
MNGYAPLIAILATAAALIAVGFAIRLAGHLRVVAAALERSRSETKQARDARDIAFGALRFYAADPSWRPNGRRKHSLVFRDRGEVARAALAGQPVQPIIDRLIAAQESAIAADLVAADLAMKAKESFEAEKKKIDQALADVEGGAP